MSIISGTGHPEEIAQKFGEFNRQLYVDVSTPAHRAISDIINAKPGSVIITENVDLKHEAEGSRHEAIHLDSKPETFDLVKKRADAAKVLVTVGLSADDRAVIAYLKEKNPDLKVVAFALPPRYEKDMPNFLQGDYAIFGDCQQILPETAETIQAKNNEQNLPSADDDLETIKKNNEAKIKAQLQYEREQAERDRQGIEAAQRSINNIPGATMEVVKEYHAPAGREVTKVNTFVPDKNADQLKMGNAESNTGDSTQSTSRETQDNLIDTSTQAAQAESSTLEPDLTRKENIYLVEQGKEKGYSQQELIQKIQKEGVNPFQYILDQINSGVRIIGLGESHGADSQTEHESTLFELLKSIQDKSGIEVGTLALEIKPQYKTDIEEKHLIPSDILVQHGKLFPKILEYARDNGIKLACVDLLQNSNPQRNAAMQSEVARIASENPDAVTLFYVGSGHVMHFSGINKHEKLSDMYPREKYISIFQKDMPKSESLGEKLLLTNKGDERFNYTPTHEFGMPWDLYGNYRATIFVPNDKNKFWQ